MTTLSFDDGASDLRIETRAKGMLAKLAHDLSIASNKTSATVKLEEGRATVELRVAAAQLEVDGVRKGSDVDRGVLSGSDRTEIQRKIRDEVIKSSDVVVTMDAHLGSGALEEGSRSVDASGRIELGGKSARVSARVDISVAAARVTLAGKARVNLPSLSITPPKGPLGAFRVDDDVEVVFRLVFDRA